MDVAATQPALELATLRGLIARVFPAHSADSLPDVPIRGITDDSRDVRPGYLFARFPVRELGPEIYPVGANCVHQGVMMDVIMGGIAKDLDSGRRIERLHIALEWIGLRAVFERDTIVNRDRRQGSVV